MSYFVNLSSGITTMARPLFKFQVNFTGTYYLGEGLKVQRMEKFENNSFFLIYTIFLLV